LMLAPLPDTRALDHRIWRRSAKTEHLSGFFRRVLQLHVCVIYFFSGLAKSLGAGWWNGGSLWRALSSPPFNVIPNHLLVYSAWLFPFLGIGVVLLELTYPIFIWWKRTRLIWLTGILAMHTAIGLAMGLYLFALIMIVLNLAAFGPSVLATRTSAAESDFSAFAEAN
jgi:hypothetical protein